MNGSTMCDLSYDKATLDYQAMMDVAKAAIHAHVESINEHLYNMRTAIGEQNHVGTLLHAQWASEEARRLVTATDVLAALIGGVERSEVVLVNKPTKEK